MKVLLKTSLLLGIFQLAVVVHLFAAPAAYWDYDDFMAALPGLASVLSFPEPPGHFPDPLRINDGDTVEGITFNYPAELVADAWGDTSSGWGSLGQSDSDGGWMRWQISLSFAPQNAFGMYLITEYGYPGIYIWLPNGLIALRNGQKLADNSWAYFVGFIDTENSFTQAKVIGLGYDGYRLDDIITAKASAVPVPGTLVLLGAGLLGLAGVGRNA